MKSSLLLLLLLLSSCSLKDDKIPYDGKYSYWTEDLGEIELIMSYILDYNEYKTFKILAPKDKIEFLDAYWTKIDPDKSTSDNELLNELNSRVLESKELFSGFDGGLLSDRAKIYIVYGPPNSEYIGKNHNNSEVLTWKYKTGYEFNFIIDSFGRYKLIN